MKTIKVTKESSVFQILDHLSDDYTIISRSGQDAVLMSLERFNGLMETVYLLKEPANARHLKHSIRQYRAGKSISRYLLND